MGTVQQFPVQGNPTTAPAATLAGVLREVVDAKVGPEASFAQREAAALALANDATRLFLQDDLLARIIHEGTEFSRNTNAPVWYKGCVDNTLATTEALA